MICQTLKVSVAILTWNRCEHVLKAIESAMQQTYRPTEIVVVDSASSDDTVEAIKARYPTVKLIRLHRNMGCPEGRNIAFANCIGDIIFSLDDDGWIAPNTLEVCVDRFNKYKDAGIVTCRILAPNEESDKFNDDDRFSHLFSGGASAIRKDVLKRAGYYPSDFFRQTEEGDLVLRVFDSGYEILNCPEAVMYHEKSPINRCDKLFWFYGCRNELYTVFRRYPWHFVFPSIIQKIISWISLGILRGATLYILAGVFSAIVKMPRLLTQRSPVSSSAIHKLLSMKLRGRFWVSNIKDYQKSNGTKTGFVS